MAEPIRVVQLVARMNRGGVESWLMTVWRRLDRSQYRFTFLTLSSDPGDFDEEIRDLGGGLVRCPFDGERRAFQHRLGKTLADLGCDVLHSHVLFFSGITLGVGASVGVPIRVSHAHSTGDGRRSTVRRRLYRWAMRRRIGRYATQGLACSTQAANYLFPNGWHTDPGYRVSPCTIDPSSFEKHVNKDTLRRELGLPTNVQVIGHVGSFRYAKNHEFLLRIFAEIHRRRPGTHLLLIGDGPLRAQLETLTRELSIDRAVTFAGVRADVPILMTHVVDLLVFPSRYEGMAMAVLESQCAAIPALASDALPREVCLVPELVRWARLADGPESWSQSALNLLDQPPFDRVAARNAIASSDFSIGASLDMLRWLYDGKLPTIGSSQP